MRTLDKLIQFKYCILVVVLPVFRHSFVVLLQFKIWATQAALQDCFNRDLTLILAGQPVGVQPVLQW